MMNIKQQKEQMLKAIELIQKVNNKLDELYYAEIAKLETENKKAA